MGKLGDLFPEDEKRKFIDRHLRPGQVLYLHCRFTNPQKDKYLVLVHLGTRPLFFVINSEIHDYIASRPDLLRCQVQLSAADNDFLRHDSVLNCGEVIDRFSEDQVRDQVLADMSRISGELSESTKKEIIRVVRGARTISPRHKGLIVESLK